ncbi:hypothetical protein HNR42_003584 [Deinobacterium chartae]|uniref:Uncharacterized protein n=1 Tax=Deinobacterium chartae TaxID=521158 RepID=A0A841I6J6_9DEIO|nr:hypothetical protein [Deinobacterium chartae]MBB6100118.1 hypothetical protein [Deinobacterium chartae]
MRVLECSPEQLVLRLDILPTSWRISLPGLLALCGLYAAHDGFSRLGMTLFGLGFAGMGLGLLWLLESTYVVTLDRSQGQARVTCRDLLGRRQGPEVTCGLEEIEGVGLERVPDPFGGERYQLVLRLHGERSLPLSSPVGGLRSKRAAAEEIRGYLALPAA